MAVMHAGEGCACARGDGAEQQWHVVARAVAHCLDAEHAAAEAAAATSASTGAAGAAVCIAGGELRHCWVLEGGLRLGRHIGCQHCGLHWPGSNGLCMWLTLEEFGVTHLTATL